METNTKETKTTGQELKQFLSSIPAGDVSAFERRLIVAVKTNPTIFRNWRLSITKVPILEREIMNQIATEVYQRKIFIDNG